MRYIADSKEQLKVLSALASEVRIAILKLLMEKGRMSMNDLAEALGVTAGALTSHIRKLEEGGLVRINSNNSGHGNLKICEPHLDKILFVFSRAASMRNEFRSHLRVGQYASCHIYPTCGLSTSQALVGDVDDPRYFTSPRHFDADILWFTQGYVEYMVPCIIPSGAVIDQINISAEISSEAPGSNSNWPSDIHFYINGTLLGMWTSPGDFADAPGLFTPDWWFSNWTQYGLLKTISVRQDGSYIDNQRISDVTIGKLSLRKGDPILFRFAVPETARHIGGLTIFGRDFGKYNQDIEFRISYH